MVFSGANAIIDLSTMYAPFQSLETTGKMKDDVHEFSQMSFQLET